MNFRNLVITLLVMMFTFLAFSSSVEAQVTVVRGGQENPVISIAKSTMWGALTGVILGLALNLVLESDTEDVSKWTFVGGTFAGFFYGIYHVANRPQPSASLIQFNTKGLAKVNVPQPQVRFNRDRFSRQKSVDFKINLMSLSL